MGSVYLGIIDGYATDSAYGQYKLWLKYDSCTRANSGFSTTLNLNNAYIYAERARNYKWTTNTIYIDSVTVAGVALNTGSWKGYNSDTGNSRVSYSTSKKSITFTAGLSKTSATISVKGHRSGQSKEAQEFSGTLSFSEGYGAAEGPEASITTAGYINSALVTVSGGDGGTNNDDTGDRHIYYTTDNTKATSSNGTGINLGTERTVTIPNIGGTKLRVRAYTISERGDNPGGSEVSADIPLYTGLSKPGKPTITSTNNKNTPKAQYTVKWSASSSSSSTQLNNYTVQIRKNDTDYSKTVTSNTCTFTSTDVNGLIPTNILKVRIKANSKQSGFSSSWSNWSDPIEIRSAGIIHAEIPGVGPRECQVYIKDSANVWHEATSVFANIDISNWKESI